MKKILANIIAHATLSCLLLLSACFTFVILGGILCAVDIFFWPTGPYEDCVIANMGSVNVYAPKARKLITCEYGKRILITNDSKNPAYIDVITAHKEVSHRQDYRAEPLITWRQRTDTVLVSPGDYVEKTLPHRANLCTVRVNGVEAHLNAPTLVPPLWKMFAAAP